MKLTTKTRYGMRAMTELAMKYNSGPVSVSYIARKEGISIPYLEQLLNRLRKGNIVKSIRGAHGGYVLAKAPRLIKVYDIVKVFEGDISLVFCISDGNDKEKCSRLDDCVSRSLWQTLNESIRNVLESVSLEDLCVKFGKDKMPEEKKQVELSGILV